MASKTNEDYWVGFDLGGTKMLATVYDASFQAVGRKRRRTKGHEGVDKGMDRIIQTIQQACEDAELDTARLSGIGIGCPGPVDLDEGIVLEAVNLGWRDAPVRDALSREFDCPIVLLNDVDAGVYGENRFGAAKKARCVLGVFPGTGIGGGCVYEGRIIRGKQRSCMEIGHIQVVQNGKFCGCGHQGCLETEASRLAIAGQAAMAAYRGQAPNLLKLVGTNLSEIRSGVIAEAIQLGDTIVEAVVRRAAGMIGIAVSNFIHLMSPDVVVLGGGLVEALPDLFVDEVTRTAQQRVMKPFVDTFRVVAAELGDDAAVMGAAGWAEFQFSAVGK